MRDEGAAEHALGLFGGFVDRFRDANAAFFPGARLFEFALAAPTGVDLGLDHPYGAIERACGGLGLFTAQNDAAFADRCAVTAQQGLCLIFVDVHALPPLGKTTGVVI